MIKIVQRNTNIKHDIKHKTSHTSHTSRGTNRVNSIGNNQPEIDMKQKETLISQNSAPIHWQVDIANYMNKSTWRTQTSAKVNPVRIWSPHPNHLHNLAQTSLSKYISTIKFSWRSGADLQKKILGKTSFHQWIVV